MQKSVTAITVECSISSSRKSDVFLFLFLFLVGFESIAVPMSSLPQHIRYNR